MSSYIRRCLCVVILGSMWAASEPANALPVFARQYGVSCSTCHVSITRRNQFGDAFRRNGYRWPGEEGAGYGAQSVKPIETEGQSLLVTSLPASIPLALSATFSGAYSFNPDAQEKTILGTPSLNLLLGGSLGEHLGFFGTWAGQGAPNELFVVVREPFSSPWVSFKVGLFEQSTTLFKINEAILTPILIGSAQINGHATARGRLGIEAFGTVTPRLSWAAGAVLNDGVGSAVDGYYQLAYRLWGTSFRGEEVEIDLDDESDWATFREAFSVTVAHYGYFGEVSDRVGRDLAQVRRLGLEAQLQYESWMLWGGLQVGHDNNAATFRKFNSLTALAEVSYGITPWLRPMYSFQFQDTTILQSAFGQHDFGVFVIVLENVRLRGRFTFTDNGRADETADLQAFLAF